MSTPAIPGEPGRAEGQLMTCALRALNICDGHQLEADPGALTQCPHEALRHAREHLSPAAVAIAQQRLERLIEETAQPPLF